MGARFSEPCKQDKHAVKGDTHPQRRIGQDCVLHGGPFQPPPTARGCMMYMKPRGWCCNGCQVIATCREHVEGDVLKKKGIRINRYKSIDTKASLEIITPTVFGGLVQGDREE